jgi:Fe-S-cluster containining protein
MLGHDPLAAHLDYCQRCCQRFFWQNMEPHSPSLLLFLNHYQIFNHHKVLELSVTRFLPLIAVQTAP